MESYEAFRRVVGGDAVTMAKRLGRSSSLVHKWCEPHADFTDSGTRNPLDQLEIVLETAQKLNRAPRDAFAPIFYLAESVGGLFLPPVPRTIETSDYSKQLCKAIKEAGEAFATSARALEDDNLSPNERRLILRDIYEAIAELSAFARLVEAGK
ncbi:MAG: hypothetical protein FDZ69_07585 [Deltaproteobacteria bacterium]|nr:MAG: hypothetical protein FDZ69_07585 [Deltaproteobacteria bacterium]